MSAANCPQAPWAFSTLLLTCALCSACGTQPQLLPDAGPLPDQQASPPDGAVRPNVTVDGLQLDVTADGPSALCPEGVSFDDSLRKVVITAIVDGKGPFQLFYDTGASTTVLSPEITGQPINSSSIVEAIDLGDGMILGPVKVYTIQMPSSVPLDGVIGNDAFAGKVVSIDYGRSQLWVDSELDEAALAACKHLGTAEPTTLPMRIDTKANLLAIKGQINGVDGELLVDTGASLGGTLQWVLDASPTEPPAVRGFWLSAGFGSFWSSFTFISEMSVGPYTVEGLVMYGQPDGSLPSDNSKDLLGTLPYSFLQHFLITIDFTRNTLRLAPIADGKLEGGYTLNGYGISLSINAQGPVVVTDVIANSPADKAGLQVNDVLLDISGIDPTKVAAEDRIGLVLTDRPGVSRSFTIEREGIQTTSVLSSTDVFAAVP